MPADLINDRQGERERPYWVLITGQAAGTNRYAWSQVNDADTAFPSLTGAFSMSGTSSASGWPAYEVNGRTDVPADSTVKVLAHLSASGKYWTFRYDGSGSVAEGCATGCGSLTGILDDWCLQLKLVCATGEFAGMDTAQFAAVFAFGAAGVWRFKVWVDGSPGSWQDFAFEWYTGSTGVPELTFSADGTPILTIDATVDKTMRTACTGADATFVGGVQNGFDGDATLRAALADCASNDFVLKAECSCCPIDGWQGDGWYCVEDTGPTDCYAVELLEANLDHCDDADPFVICSGPYASQAAAEADCPPPPTTSCCDDPIPGVLNWAITNKVGVCSCAPTSGTVTYNGTDSWDSVQFACPILECEENAEYSLWCVSGSWYYGLTGVGGSLAAASVTCPEDGPFEVVFNVTPSGGGSYTITFTAP